MLAPNREDLRQEVIQPADTGLTPYLAIPLNYFPPGSLKYSRG